MTALQAFLWILGHLAQTAWRRSGMAQNHFWHVCRNFGVVWSIWPSNDLQGRGQGQGLGAYSWPNSCNNYPRPKAHCYRVIGLISCSWHLIWHARLWHDLDLQCQGRVCEAYSGPTQQKKIMGLSLTVMEIWAFEVLPCFSIQGCVGLPYTRHRREHVLEHVRISILPRLVCGRAGESPCAPSE